MEQIRPEMLAHKYKLLVKQRLRILADILDSHSQRFFREPLPRIADICSIPAVKDIVEHEDRNRYTNKATFAEVEGWIPQICKEWREEKDTLLSELMPPPSSSQEPSEVRRRLARAVTYFKCSECSEPIAYPRILVHRCLNQPEHGSRNREPGPALENLKIEPWNWSGNRVSYQSRAEQCARAIVRAAGFVPEVAKGQNLDKADVWLECVGCRPLSHNRVVYRWRTAVCAFTPHPVGMLSSRP